MPSDVMAKSEWVERVLGVTVTLPGTSGPLPVEDAREVSAFEVLLPDLAPRLRKARREAVDALVAFGARLLDLPEIIADPRVDDLRSVIARFPGLIPPADEVLIAVENFDDADGATARSAATAEALKQVKAYAARLADGRELAGVRRIAADGFGGLAACARLSSTLQQCAATLGG